MHVVTLRMGLREPTGARDGPGVAFPRSGGGVADNGPVRARLVPITATLVAIAAVGGGCTSKPPGDPQPSTVPVGGAGAEPREALAVRAAAAKDLRYVAAYTWSGGGAVRTVTVSVAQDGTWRVDVPGGALGGQANIAIVALGDGRYQCTLPPHLSGCVKVAGPGAALPASVDPRVQNPFHDWLDVLTDRNAALSVLITPNLPNVGGTCFSVEPATVSVRRPIEGMTICYADDGVLTAVKAKFGTLVLTGQPGPAPANTVLPGPLAGGSPLSTTAPPPPPPPSASPSGARPSASPSRKR